MSKCSPIIYNGISEDIISFQNNAVMLGNKEANRIKNIITIGRLTAQKGYNYLLEAIALLKDTLLFNLYIFGEGSQKEDLMNQSKSLHLTDIVKFMGFHDNVLDYMSESDLFVSSSLWEGFPTVILEAMACGLPVVATDVSGSRELIINNYTGILVHPKRPDEIAGAINLILNSPNLARRFSKNSRSKITEYLITNVAKKYENIYSQISQNKK